MTRQPKLSVVILAKNEEKDIRDAFASATWVDELVLLDGGSTDKTRPIAKKFGAKIVDQKGAKGLNYGAWHNQALAAVKGEWLFYLDADERFTPALKKEILGILKKPKYFVWAVPRRNFLLGKELHFGGWYPDYQIRLFKKDKLKKWVGKLHERPIFKGELGHLKEPMIHIQPDSVEPMLEKSIKWSKLEAKMLLKAKHPKVAWWRILRMGLTTLFDRLVKKQGFRDGTEGWIESIYQGFHTMLVYIQLWELQQKEKKR